VANGVRSDIPCQQCGRRLGGLGHSVSDNVAQPETSGIGKDNLAVAAHRLLEPELQSNGWGGFGGDARSLALHEPSLSIAASCVASMARGFSTPPPASAWADTRVRPKMVRPAGPETAGPQADPRSHARKLWLLFYSHLRSERVESQVQPQHVHPGITTGIHH
jgi:hypothetical protein